MERIITTLGYDEKNALEALQKEMHDKLDTSQRSLSAIIKDIQANDTIINKGAFLRGITERMQWIPMYEENNHNQSQTALDLGINRATLRTRLKRWGLLPCTKV